MARAACRRMINFHAPADEAGAVDKAVAWVGALFGVRCRAQGDLHAIPLSRCGDALREAAISLSLGDGVPLTGREYRLIEQLWRIER